MLILAWLEMNFSADRVEWEMVEQKARDWLVKSNLEGKSTDELIDTAKQIGLKI